MLQPSLRTCFSLSCILLFGCTPRPENQVVIYSALDQEFAAPILSGFVRKNDSKITPQAKFDVESTKTVGLVQRILAEKQRPVCDVFWNNEIMHTLRLQKAGLLTKRSWDIPKEWPASMQAGDGSWCGFAARARVLLINSKLLAKSDERPRSVSDLADEKWKGKCGVARPLFGTTATHFTILDQVLGGEQADEFYQSVAKTAVVLSGNKQVAQAVSSGQLAWGLTDTDDAIIERDAGLPVEIIWPDQESSKPGTLRIPNTISVLVGAPHPVAANALADFLVSPLTEERLAMGDSAQLPINPWVEFQPRVLPEGKVRWMNVDFEAAADRWEAISKRLLELFP
jgi:iron(III) transport system substrate-binding protein